MIYMRGNAADYDQWRQLGNEGWDYESVLPYFRKAEDNERGADVFHGSGGPLRVSNQPYEWELAKALLEACQQAGIPFNPDFNGAQQEGCGYYQTTTKDKRRWSTAAAYLRMAQKRPNLVVRTRAHATRVLFDGSRATGVEFATLRGRQVARAGREVIVSGGVYGSPQLLQLSGVGPAGHLHDIGIDVVRDVPGVGANLQDHFNTFCTYRISRDLSLNALHYSLARRLVAGAQYLFLRSGPMSGNGMYVGALVRSDKRLERPDLQMNISAWSTVDRTAKGVVSHPFPGISISPVHLAPQGRGSVRLRNADPFASPEIRFNFLRNESDMRVMIAGVRIARSIARQHALQKLMVEETAPGVATRTDEDIAADVRRRGVSNLHPVGTCGMGRGPSGGATGGGCVGDAGDRCGQYQRAGDHDRGEGRGHDSAGCSLSQFALRSTLRRCRVVMRLETAGDGEGVVLGRNDGAAFEPAAQAVDLGGTSRRGCRVSRCRLADSA